MAVWAGFAAFAGAAEPPVVPGYERLAAANTDSALQGELLLGELNCVACHAAETQRVSAKGAPDLRDVGARMTPTAIRDYLADPHAFKPGSTMPDLFAASEAGAKSGAVDFLTHYLVSLGGPIKPARMEGNAILAERGKALFHSVGCVACHEPQEKLENSKPAEATPKGKQVSPTQRTEGRAVRSVPLGKLAAKTTVDQLAAFLLEPHKVRPAGRMPALGLTAGEAHAIAVYLLREQLANPQTESAPPARSAGLRYAYYEADLKDCSVETLDQLTAKSRGTAPKPDINAIPGRRDDQFAVRFTGGIIIPKKGTYTFGTRSDDGSRVYIDGQLVVNNDGIHSSSAKSKSVDLDAGDHTFAVTYYEHDGEESLRVGWSGPGFDRQEIPADVFFNLSGKAMVPLGSAEFSLDPQKAQMGARMFALIGCASCHQLEGVKSMRKAAKPLAALDPAATTGCLSANVGRGLPQYHLNDEQKAAIAQSLKNRDRLAQAPTSAERVTHTLAAMNCIGCHVREKVGGPGPDRDPFFKMAGEFDMGDEGRLPPRLTEVGAKLKPEAIDAIVFEGKLHVRPVLATRMPRFQRETMPDFVKEVEKADSADESKPSPFTEAIARDGRQLVGTKGLGCVNCHSAAGAKSLGMPGPDLATTHERIKPKWFAELMKIPASKNPATRMPAFWTDDASLAFRKLGGGTVQGQIDAIYTYLSLGRTMPLPAGLQVDGKGFELVVGDTPLIHRTFMAEVGPRAILTGYPESLNIAFDANVVRLAKAWRGRFFNAGGMWDGRGGSLLGPLGTDIIDLPPGPAFAVVSSPNMAWPMPKDRWDRNLGGKFRGYRLDKDERPTFQYELSGVRISEQPIPVLKPGGAELVRRFELKTDAAVADLQFLAGEGKEISEKSPGVWQIDGKLTLKFKGDGLKPAVREIGGHKELLVPVSFNNGSAGFDVEMSW